MSVGHSAAQCHAPTLRELVATVGLEEALSYLRRWHPTQVSDRDLRAAYEGVVAELVSLPLRPPHAQGNDDLVALKVRRRDHREVVGVANDGAEYALDYVDWAELIDLPVWYEPPMTTAEALASALWEITFYGFSRAAVNARREELLQAVEDDEELPGEAFSKAVNGTLGTPKATEPGA